MSAKLFISYPNDRRSSMAWEKPPSHPGERGTKCQTCRDHRGTRLVCDQVYKAARERKLVSDGFAAGAMIVFALIIAALLGESTGYITYIEVRLPLEVSGCQLIWLMYLFVRMNILKKIICAEFELWPNKCETNFYVKFNFFNLEMKTFLNLFVSFGTKVIC